MPKRLAENSSAQVDEPWPFSGTTKMQQLEQNIPKASAPAPAPATEAHPDAAEVRRLTKRIEALGEKIVAISDEISSLGTRILDEADPAKAAKLEAQQAELKA